MNIGQGEPAKLRAPIERLLVVGGDPNVRSVFQDCLTDHPCLVVGAGHADLAHHLECDLFSLVVLDVRAAPYDGFEALRQVRAQSDVPVILLAGGRHDDFERVIALEFGADDFLCEPLNFQELLARIRAGAEGDGDPSGLSPDGQISHIDSQGPPPERAAPSFQGDPSCV